MSFRVACKEALTSYNSLDNPAAGAPVEQLNELEEVFKKAAKTDTPAEVLHCLTQYFISHCWFCQSGLSLTTQPILFAGT